MHISHTLPGFANADALEIAEMIHASGSMALPEQTIGRIFAALPPDERPGWLHDRLYTAARDHHGVHITRSEARDLGSRLLHHSQIEERATAH